LKQYGFGVVFTGKLLNLVIIFADLLGEGIDRSQNGQECGLKGIGDSFPHFAMEKGSGAGWKTATGSFHYSSSVIDELGAGAD
jgi:hypothetical protein